MRGVTSRSSWKLTQSPYGIKGTDIQIKMFDDRLEVDSPGAFAGMVKKENIR